MTDSPPEAPRAASYRVRIEDDLIMTLDGHLVTVATARWAPGTFVYDVAFLSVEVKEKRNEYSIVMSGIGQSINFQVLPFKLTEEKYQVFARFIAAAVAARDAALEREHKH